MNLDFMAMKPILQAEYDRIMDQYPTDMSAVEARIPFGGDGYDRKLAIIEAAAELCPVHLVCHYPFACELDVGQERGVVWKGIGQLCKDKSGVDFSALYDFRRRLRVEENRATFNDFTDFFHGTLDHDQLLAEGFSGVYDRCLTLNGTERDPEKRRWREHVMAACLAVKKLALRFHQAAADALAAETDPEEQANLTRMVSGALVPWTPAETFFDALTSILRTVVIISYVDGMEMTCYGQLDRLLEPYYRREAAAGTLSRDEAAYLVTCFLHRPDFHAHFNSERKMYDNSMTVMVGGCDREGRPVYNEITDMILDAYRDHGLITPKLNARAGESSPRPYLQRLAELMLSGRNNLIVENDGYIIPMFERMGLPTDDARRYVANGCQEVICPNQMHSRAFTYLNLPGVLTDTLEKGFGGGLSPLKEEMYAHGAFDVSDFDALEASFLENLRSMIAFVTGQFHPFEKIQEKINPLLLQSGFTADCLARGVDYAAAGARNNHKTLSLVGFGTLCDSLLAMKDAYARDDAERLAHAVRVNFDGFDQLRQELIHSTHRFGHSEDADRYAHDLAHKLAQVSRGIFSGQGIEWGTSLFTYSLFESFGSAGGATPDGRPAGEPYSRQSNMARLPVLTAAAQSMAQLTEADFHDVGMFDFAIPAAAVTEELTAATADFIAVCLDLKLPVLQSNFVSRNTLEDAMAHPEAHGDLVVRVCGYSAYFTELGVNMQKEILGRIAPSSAAD